MSSLYEGGIKELAANQVGPESLPDPDRQVSVDNPFCGDRVDLEVTLDGGRIAALGHRVRGCMLCQAAANALAQSAPGLTAAEISVASDSLDTLLKEGSSELPSGWESLQLFEPVSRHKSRHGCVTLPFRALREALS